MSRAPFLLVDAGNTRIKWALVDAEGALVDAEGASLRAGVFAHAEAAERPDWSALPRPDSAWISNVAGETAAATIAAAIDAHWPNLPRTTIRACARQCGVTNSYTEPERLGSDRWAGMIGAHAAFAGEHLLIATLGTATTLEALHADGTFSGGLIAPGWSLMMRALGEHTAQLPTLGADSARVLSSGEHVHRWFATDTHRAISAGALLAQTGLIEHAWHELRRAWDAPVRLVIGGGAAEDVAHALNVPHTRHDGLVLSGLAIIAAVGAASKGDACAPLPA